MQTTHESVFNRNTEVNMVYLLLSWKFQIKPEFNLIHSMEELLVLIRPKRDFVINTLGTFKGVERCFCCCTEFSDEQWFLLVWQIKV